MAPTLTTLLTAAGDGQGPRFLSDQEQSFLDHAALIVAAGAMVAALLVIAKAARRAFRSARRMWQAMDALHVLVDEQLRPNGGGSLVDRVKTIERCVSRIVMLEGKIGALEHRVDHHHGRIVPTDERPPPEGPDPDPAVPHPTTPKEPDHG